MSRVVRAVFLLSAQNIFLLIVAISRLKQRLFIATVKLYAAKRRSCLMLLLPILSQGRGLDDFMDLYRRPSRARRQWRHLLRVRPLLWPGVPPQHQASQNR